jgi:sterol desaturase/sphingolipid hydroxylase (fatty acid hydroxylase superfamily)
LFDVALKPLLTIVVIGFVFTALEVLRPARTPPGFRWQRYFTDGLHLNVGGLFVRIGVTVGLAWALGKATVFDVASGLPLWLQMILVLALCDLMVWLIHRAFHAVPFRWGFHKVHHSSLHLDRLATYRVHPLEQILNSVLVPLPALLLGFSPAVVILYGIVYQWHAILLHSNVAVSLGPLEHVIATNRWHHADHVEAYDRNFGTQLTVWDKLFGTAHKPSLPRPERFGVAQAPRESFVAHLVSPFVRSVSR